MEVWFRHCDARYSFLWESSAQPAARWHGQGEGPVQYFADTADGAWAEFIRHEEFREPADLEGIERVLWAVEVDEQGETVDRPNLQGDVLLGGEDSYPACQAEARALRARGATALEAPSAALVAGGGRGQRVEGGRREADARDGRVLVLFGTRPELRGFLCGTVYGTAGPDVRRLLALVRPLG